MTSVSLQERLEDATEDLSRCQVASDVAEILRVEGVQGERQQPCRCPIAVLTIKRLGLSRGDTIWVDGEVIEIYQAGFSGVVAVVDLPPAATAFIAEFDGSCTCGATECGTDPGGWDEFAVTSP